MRLLTFIFALVFTGAAVLSASAGILVTASLFIADRAPQSTEFLEISLFVSGVFLALGMLLAGIELQIFGIARLSEDRERDAGLRTRVRRLLILLVIAGVALCGFLAVLTYAILARIDQGFAVFG